MTPHRALYVAATLALSLSGAPGGAAASTIVRTDRGVVAGAEKGGVVSWKGVPFARPPVGSLRWRAPQPAPAWTGVRQAVTFGPQCTQPPARPGAPAGPPQGEDCLYLNIYRPAGATTRLPVMVWVPGGGLVAGAGSEPIYEGGALAAKGVVLVTINYRVGRFGFFAHPALTRENADGGRLYNYGLMDQIAALQWVRRNIAGFGGDPARVTIFGESAGGASVDALMIAPPARGLFSAAISQSGYGRGAYLRIAERSPDGDAPAESIGARIATSLGMPDASIADLRAVPAERIRALFDRNDEHVFAVDGKTLRSDPWVAFERREEAPVPFIIGSNSYEQGVMDPAEQRPWAEKVVPAANWAQLAPVYGGGALRDRLLLGDIIFTTQARALAGRHAANGYPTYLYLFDVPTVWGGQTQPGAVHATDLRYVFGNLDVAMMGPPTPPSAQDKAVSTAMMGYWTAFARDRDPGSGGGVAWPRYAGDRLLRFTQSGPVAQIDPYVARVAAVNRVSIDLLPATPAP